MNPSILNLDIKHHFSKVTFLKTAFSTNISLRHSSSALFAASSGPWGIIINHSSTHQTFNSATWSVLKWDLNQIRWGHRKSRRISRRSTKPPASLALLPPEIANFNNREISAPDNVKAEVKTSRILNYTDDEDISKVANSMALFNKVTDIRSFLSVLKLSQI